ncbi:MAG: prepilin-type N-terminal cleavage/methylation domain-containing protein [Opitutaceae bacterium]
MTSSFKQSAQGKKRLSGFTLVELMVAVTLGSIILGGVLSTFLMIVRSGVRASNYSMMEAQTRRAFEQLGIDARMANQFSAVFSGGNITSFTLTIPDVNQASETSVTYGYDTSDATNKKIYVVPGTNPATTTGRIDLISKVDAVDFLRYDAASALIPSGTTTGVKHIQISVSVKRTGVGIAASTQTIRSSAFTLRNIL